jgi:tetratricopeptide (TPR) repeat protein
MVRHAEVVCRAADSFMDLYEKVILIPPGSVGGRVLSDKANALILLRRYEQARRAADRAVKLGGGAEAYYNAALALERLGRTEEAALNLTRAAQLFEERGERDRARGYYRQSWEMFPDMERNAAARAGMTPPGSDPK